VLLLLPVLGSRLTMMLQPVAAACAAAIDMAKAVRAGGLMDDAVHIPSLVSAVDAVGCVTGATELLALPS